MKKLSQDEEYILNHYQLARERALEHVEYLARTILQQHKNLEEFVISMGVWYFTKKANNALGYEVVDSDSAKYLRESRLAYFLVDWDDELKILSQPMRFTAEGPVRTDW